MLLNKRFYQIKSVKLVQYLYRLQAKSKPFEFQIKYRSDFLYLDILTWISANDKSAIK